MISIELVINLIKQVHSSFRLDNEWVELAGKGNKRQITAVLAGSMSRVFFATSINLSSKYISAFHNMTYHQIGT